MKLKRAGSDTSNISTDEPLKIDHVSALQQVNLYKILNKNLILLKNKFQEMKTFEFVVGQIHRGHHVEIANEHMMVKLIERELIERMPPVFYFYKFFLLIN